MGATLTEQGSLHSAAFHKPNPRETRGLRQQPGQRVEGGRDTSGRFLLVEPTAAVHLRVLLLPRHVQRRSPFSARGLNERVHSRSEADPCRSSLVFIAWSPALGETRKQSQDPVSVSENAETVFPAETRAGLGSRRYCFTLSAPFLGNLEVSLGLWSKSSLRRVNCTY